MALDPDFRLDRELLRRRAGRCAARYDGVDVLAREIARRMDERLDYIRITPRRVLDLGCGTGTDLLRLAERYPAADLFGLDFALPMLARSQLRSSSRYSPMGGLLRRLLGASTKVMPALAADATALPVARASMSLVWSNLMLPALHDPLPAFQEVHRVLETGGLLMFSTLGPDTLRELRGALSDRTGERVHRFIDMHDIGDALVQAGFSDPVMDMEMVTLTYAGLDELFHDLRASGSNNAASSRPRGLSGKRAWAEARATYEQLRSARRLPATFEVIQGHAWKAAPKITEDGRAVVHFHPRPAPKPST